MPVVPAASQNTNIGLESEPIAIASLRATFGGKPCPFLFSEVSESVTDLSNAIVRCTSWDPKLLHPTHSELLGVPRRENSDAPLAQARLMMVNTRRTNSKHRKSSLTT